MTRTTISNNDDIIDSRDVIARIAELEGEREDLVSAIEEAKESLDNNKAEAKNEEELQDYEDEVDNAQSALEAWDEENGEELKALKALADEADGCGDWRHGAALIRDSHFEDYARELAEDIGAINGKESWPLDYIDWERAAEALKMDYTLVDFDGVEYWIRS